MALMLAEPRYRCCVLVPLYRPFLTNTEALSLVATHRRAEGKAALLLLHPPELAGFVQHLRSWFAYRGLDGQTFESLQCPAPYFRGVSAYSSLLLSEAFYAQLSGYEWLFIVQLDALLLSDQWPVWLDSAYSYIGPPWFVGLDQPRLPLRPLGGGNGGFSLRRVADCAEVLRYRGCLYRHWRDLELITLPDQRWRAEGRALRRLFAFAGSFETIDLFEDLFWSFMAHRISSTFSVAPFSQSIQFAFETEPRTLFRSTRAVPVGCHAHERYDPDFWHQIWSSDPSLIGLFEHSAMALVADLKQE